MQRCVLLGQLMRVCALLSATALLGCDRLPLGNGEQGADGRPTARRAAPGQEASEALALPGWLNPAIEAQTAVRLETPSGVELRQALYVGDDLMLLLRDYSQRDDAKPDPHWLSLVAGSDHSVRKLELAQDALPTYLTGGHGNKCAALLCWLPTVEPAKPEEPVAGEEAQPTEPEKPQSGYDLSKPQFAFYPYTQRDGAASEAKPGASSFGFIADGVMPIAVGPGSVTYLRPFAGAKVEQGLVTAGCDWDAAPQYWQSETESGPQEVADPAIVAAPDGKRAAGLRPGLGSGTSGAVWNLYLWTEGRSLESKLLLSLPVAAGALPDDSRSLGWVDSRLLAVALPQFAGGEQLNWRLMVIDVKTKQLTVVADHLPPRSHVVTLDGVLFYCLQDAASRDWQLWANSVDGLHQRLLLRATKTQALSIEDAYSSRLLLNRQYFGEESDTLHNALIELALTPLGTWRVEQGSLRPTSDGGLIDLDAPPAKRGRAEEGFFPDKPADRYKPRGGGEGGGGDKEPPDLTLPGL